MVQVFNEEVHCAQGLSVEGALAVRKGSLKIHIEGPEIFSISGDQLRFSLSPSGLIFHHPSGVNTIEIDGENGDIILPQADCAEDFDVAQGVQLDPGTVVVVNDAGALQPCDTAYDKRVVGVVSGAGDYKPGLVLDRRAVDRPRVTVALMGKVFCKVDTRSGAIQVGDLLTPSSVEGHAMKAADPLNALGSIIGKALRPAHEGQGLIPILAALQ